MAVLAAADAVMFAIEAGLKLYGEARLAYVEQTRAREVTFPLPGPPLKPTVLEINFYFEQGGEGHGHLEGNERLKTLFEQGVKLRDKFQRDQPAAFSEYSDWFRVLRAKDLAHPSDTFTTPDDLAALFSIAQFRRGEEPNPSAIQRIAGTLVEIGIDYYSTGPGRIRGRSTRARVLRTVLGALDDQSFSQEGFDGVAEKLFVAALETADEHPDWFTGNENGRELVGALAHGLANDVNDRLAQLDAGERLFDDGQLGDTAELLFRSVLRHGAETVLNSPEKFLGVEGEGNQALVARAGTALFDALVPADGTGIDLAAGFTLENMDGVVKAALAVVAEHPELVGAEPGKRPELATVVQEIASGLAESQAKLGSGLVPEAIRLTLERSAANLTLLTRPKGAAETLATTAMRTLLEQLATPVPNGVWTPSLANANVLGILESVLDEAADHPDWVAHVVGDRPAPAAAASAILASLAARDLSKLDQQSVREILVEGLRAASSRLDFLDTLDIDGTKKLAIAHVLDAVFEVAAGRDARASWTLARGSVLSALTALVLEQMTRFGVTPDSVAELRAVLGEAGTALANRGQFDLDALEQELAARLAA